jgi:Zn-dependent protease
MTDINAIVQSITILALPLVFAITLHEAAHGYAARYFGDSTAWQAGRISLNPLRHIDPVGTILIPLSILLFSGGSFLFGYAKPVPVDFSRLRNPKKDMFWVAAAGPGANLFMACAWALAFKLVVVTAVFQHAAGAHGRNGNPDQLRADGAQSDSLAAGWWEDRSQPVATCAVL